MQLGYFKANGKFYATEQFRRTDVDYVANSLGIPPVDVGLSAYRKKIPLDHRKRILKLQDWQLLSNKFSKAIFFSNNQEFKQGAKGEQEIEVEIVYIAMLDIVVTI